MWTTARIRHVVAWRLYIGFWMGRTKYSDWGHCNGGGEGDEDMEVDMGIDLEAI